MGARRVGLVASHPAPAVPQPPRYDNQTVSSGLAHQPTYQKGLAEAAPTPETPRPGGERDTGAVGLSHLDPPFQSTKKSCHSTWMLRSPRCSTRVIGDSLVKRLSTFQYETELHLLFSSVTSHLSSARCPMTRPQPASPYRTWVCNEHAQLADSPAGRVCRYIACLSDAGRARSRPARESNLRRAQGPAARGLSSFPLSDIAIPRPLRESQALSTPTGPSSLRGRPRPLTAQRLLSLA